MPRLIEAATAEQIELGDLIEGLVAGAFDPSDEDCYAEWAPALAKLANNRRFLGDIVIAQLKERIAGGAVRNPYTAQVILLHGGSKKFMLRANLWPAATDSVVLNSGTDPFFYGMPHDHNFTFLTVGYLGPGYWSDYYEYDYASVTGFAGEKVDLRFVERSRLDRGKILLYRKHLDVHRQAPPDEMSVSLNILGLSPNSEFLDQYQFDIERSEIAAIANPSALETLVLLAGQFGGGNGRDLVESFAAGHPCERMCFAAWKAKASTETDIEERIATYEDAAGQDSPYVREMARREAARLRLVAAAA